MPKSLKYFNLPPLPPAFYRGEVLRVARSLLGKVLINVNESGEKVAVVITEVEAYSQFGDESSHTFRGPTPRNQAMFEKGGTCYVYRSYGIHNCMNVVTGSKGVGEGVLLRGGVPLVGEDLMKVRRGPKSHKKNLCSGPGCLTQALQIEAKHNGQRFDAKSFKIVNAGIKVPKNQIQITPRIGISKSKDLPWRFVWQIPL